MRLATVVAGAGMMTTVALGGPAHAAITPVGAAAAEQESFESGMGAWVPDTDGRARAWQISRSTDQAYDGKYSLAFYLDGRNDDGTIWIERKFTARPNTTVTVSTTFRIYSSASSDLNTWAVVGYAGTHDPETTADIRTVVGLVNSKGWTPYTYTRKVTTDSTGSVWVAVGIWATYEVIRTNYVDLVQTSIA